MKTIFFCLIIFVNLELLFQSTIKKIEAVVVKNEDPEIGEIMKNSDDFQSCAMPTIKCSSELDSTNGISYNSKSLNDLDLTTAWVPKSNNYGIGEVIECTFQRRISDKLTVTSLVVFNGYRKSRNLWNANCRVKDLKMFVNGKPYAIIRLKDAYNHQLVDIGKFKLNKDNLVFKFEILSVYKGTKYKDVAITEIQFDGTGCF